MSESNITELKTHWVAPTRDSVAGTGGCFHHARIPRATNLSVWVVQRPMAMECLVGTVAMRHTGHGSLACTSNPVIPRGDADAWPPVRYHFSGVSN